MSTANDRLGLLRGPSTAALREEGCPLPRALRRSPRCGYLLNKVAKVFPELRQLACSRTRNEILPSGGSGLLPGAVAATNRRLTWRSSAITRRT